MHALPHFLEQNVEWNCSDAVLEDVELSDHLRVRKRYHPGRQALRGNCMLGQLTAKGESQLRSLGANFRATYLEKIKLMPANEFDPRLVHLRSTDVERTVRSAYHFLTGLYPEFHDVVDLNVIERPRDNAFPNRFFCPFLGATIDALKTAENFTKYARQHLDPLRKKYSELWKFPVDLHVLDDTIRARMCHDFPMPPLMEDADAEAIMKAVSGMENLLVAPFHVQQLSMGSFFNDWLGNFEMDPRPRFVLYSNHDSTLRAILAAFDIFDDNWPPYASHIALELWEQTSTGLHFVTVQYDGETMKIGACDNVYFCPYRKFARLLRSFLTGLCDEATGSLHLSIA